MAETMAYFDQRVSISRAAEILGMSATWMRQAADAGLIPCERPGQHRRFKMADLIAYQAKHSNQKVRRVAVLAYDPLAR